MTIPEYYRNKEHYPLSGMHYGTQSRIIQPRNFKDPPYALELEVWEEGMKQGSVMYAPMDRPEPVVFKYPRIDGINLYNRGYLPIRIRDLYHVYSDEVMVEPVYLKDGILKPDTSVYYKIQWLNTGVDTGWVALRLQKPFTDITIELNRRV